MCVCVRACVCVFVPSCGIASQGAKDATNEKKRSPQVLKVCLSATMPSISKCAV